MSNATSNRITVEAVGDCQLKGERVFNAPREKVYAAMTDPALIPQWWGRHKDTTTVEEMDVKVGGRYRFFCEGPDGAHGFSGTYRELEPPSRIVQTFEWDGMPGHISVDAVDLEDLGDGRTRVIATSTFHFPEERDGMLGSGMETGMNETYDRLEELLQTL